MNILKDTIDFKDKVKKEKNLKLNAQLFDKIVNDLERKMTTFKGENIAELKNLERIEKELELQILGIKNVYFEDIEDSFEENKNDEPVLDWKFPK